MGMGYRCKNPLQLLSSDEVERILKMNPLTGEVIAEAGKKVTPRAVKKLIDEGKVTDLLVPFDQIVGLGIELHEPRLLLPAEVEGRAQEGQGDVEVEDRGNQGATLFPFFPIYVIECALCHGEPTHI